MNFAKMRTKRETEINVRYFDAYGSEVRISLAIS